MPTFVAANNSLLATERDAAQAREALTDLAMDDRLLLMGGDAEPGARPLPAELAELIRQVLEAVATGRPVTVAALPRELTTSNAAALLGVSRPTLMKMIDREEVPVHKVGTHTRLASEDVLALRAERRVRERAAFEQLRADALTTLLLLIR